MLNQTFELFFGNILDKNIQFTFQLNISRYNQRRVSGIKYLGELYNYQLVENEVVFTVLYALLTFGNAGEGKIFSFILTFRKLFIIFISRLRKCLNGSRTIADSAEGGLTPFWELFTVVSCVPKDFKC